MPRQIIVCAALSFALFSVFSAVGSQYTATTGSPTVPPVTCAPGVPICDPLIDPCDPRAGNTCPNFPNAKCVASYCGACLALFYVNGQDVTQQCRGDGTVVTVPPKPGCPPENAGCAMGVPIVQCFVEPCAGKKCPGNSYATCCNNYCGGCNAFFYANGVNVTGSC